jgi:transposase InsO family protein
MALNLSFVITERISPAKFLIWDRDTKFTSSFDEVFRPGGIRIIRTPVRARGPMHSPNASWALSAESVFDRMLIFHRRQLEVLLNEFIDHYNTHRPHRSLGQTPPLSMTAAVLSNSHPDAKQPGRTDRLGGLIHEYELAA